MRTGHHLAFSIPLDFKPGGFFVSAGFVWMAYD